MSSGVPQEISRNVRNLFFKFYEFRFILRKIAFGTMFTQKRGVWTSILTRPSFFRSQFEVQTDFLTFSP